MVALAPLAGLALTSLHWSRGLRHYSSASS